MKIHLLFLGVALAVAAPLAPARAQDTDKSNYPAHVAKKLDVCPFLRLTAFDFKTSYVDDQGFRRKYSFAWHNEGKQPITAFEVHVLKFNPFDERFDDFTTIFPGHDSGNYLPLQPGESDDDGTNEGSDAELFTALAYVDKIRFADGSIWRATPATVDAQIKQAVPALADGAPDRAAKPTPKK